MKRSRPNETGQLDLFGEPPPSKRIAPEEPHPQTPPPRVPAPQYAHLAEVAVEGPVRDAFTYGADAVWEQLRPGMRVRVPFGPRAVTGYYLGERARAGLEQDGIDPAKIRPIQKVLDAGANGPLLTDQLLALARWIAHHYAAPLGSTLSAMLPAGVKSGSASARVRLIAAAVPVETLIRHAEQIRFAKPRQAALLLALVTNLQGSANSGEEELFSVPALLGEAEAPESALKALVKAGLARVTETRAGSGRDRLDHTEEQTHELTLSAEQDAALTRIEEAVRRAAAGTAPQPPGGFLLQGVTGSGKTEVYLRALKTALSLGKQGIVLVPEIALTPQTAQRFQRRLGAERVAVLHSHMTDGERAEAWHAIRDGKIDVVIGARSALFAPLARLGLIVIDEEHENAFKQESTPRYHARDVAMELARLTRAVLVLGSATPSFEALHAAKTKRLGHLFLTQRAAGRPLPPVVLIDLAQENREARRYTYLSRQLLLAMGETLARREQTILFMNRRGFATVITCLHCGHTEKCAQCDIALTSHRTGATEHADLLTCHYCGMTRQVPECCANCKAPGVKHWGLGTERVESEVRKLFPQARVARMDSGTMTRRTSYLETLGNFRAGRLDILIGTQMIAKGLDFPNVTLVGVVMADTALHMPDFRSRERTFQLLAQVAGRAGRSDKGGRVIIQTHLPNDPAVKSAASHDYEAFALNELQERRAFGYPPFSRLTRIILRGKDAQATRQAAESIAESLRAQVPAPAGQSAPEAVILGPAEPPLARLEGFFRQHILIKAADSEAVSRLLSGPAAALLSKLRKVEACVDVDAIGML